MDAMLKMTEVELELLSDNDMYLFFEEGIRGGISMITGRYSKANNPYLGTDYNLDEPTKCIQYLNVNNLYGWAMSKQLPVADFEWLSEIEQFLKDPNSIVNCTLKVDLDYPDELYDVHSDYQLAPENVEVNDTKKLIPHLGPWIGYVAHHNFIRNCLKNSMVLRKIHSGIKYRESNFLSKYIDSNTKSRACAKSDFEKDFFKLMNNSVFGKTMENIRGHSKIKIVNGLETETLERYIAKPNFKGLFEYEESNLVSVNMGFSTVTLNKPIYLGQAILDISKTLMYDFHYDYMRSKYGDKARLLFTDTDSLCYEVTTDDFYDDIRDDVPAWFDMSAYPADHPAELPRFNKVIGFMKDEASGQQIEEFVGLRSKLYAYKIHGYDTMCDDPHCTGACGKPDCIGRGGKKCKGVKKPVVKNYITLQNYKDCLFNKKIHFAKFNTFRSRKHDLTTDCITKVALLANDDKRYILPGGIHMLAIGHHRISVNLPT